MASFRAHVALLAVAAVLGSGQCALTTPWEKVLMTSPSVPSAMCLDGSPGGFYIRNGTGSGVSKWLVFHQGGGWCSSSDNCYARAQTTLGSSKQWPATYTDTYEGSQLFATPPFDDYNIVYAMYCDGGSWTGNSTDRASGGQVIYYRGRALLDSLIDDLLARGMADAEEVIYAGCSAGAMTSQQHADYVASRLPQATRVLALADAMFSLEADSYSGIPLFPRRMQWGFTAWNSAASVNQDCLAHYGEADGWKCLFGGNLGKFVRTPLFYVQSKYDSWQQKAIIGANCSIASCSGSIQNYWVQYGHWMVGNMTALPAQHGAFLSNCVAHCQTGMPTNWGGATINGTSMRDAFIAWHSGHVSGDSVANGGRWIEQCDVDTCGSDTC